MAENTAYKRIFKIGTTIIQADDSLAHLDNEGVRAILKRTYPEVAYATIRETTLEAGTIAVVFTSVPGRKG
jgi:hypothetical protein